jgi:hypothetical protein
MTTDPIIGNSGWKFYLVRTSYYLPGTYCIFLVVFPVKPLVHTPESIYASRIGRIGMVDDAVREGKRAHIWPREFSWRRRCRSWPRNHLPMISGVVTQGAIESGLGGPGRISWLACYNCNRCC